jgi:hypothetical protein
MALVRLAYTTQFLVALIAVFVVWDEVGGPYHLDLMPWWLKLGLGTGVAYTVVRATAAAVSGSAAWNVGTLKWCVATLALLGGCAIANYYCNVYGEEIDEQNESQTSLASAAGDADQLVRLLRERPRSSGARKVEREEIHEREPRIGRASCGASIVRA